jgi:hypothetical protein
MITRRFKIEFNEEHGYAGLRPIGVPHADPLRGMAIAHDILEHFKGDDGSIRAEFEAFGAMVWIRHQGAYWSTYTQQRLTDISDNLEGEFEEQCHYWMDGRDLPSVRPCKRLQDDDIEEVIQRVVAAGLDRARRDCGLDDDCEFISPNTRMQLIYCMRRGFRRAASRYRGHDPYHVCHVFHQVELAVEKLLIHGEECSGLDARIAVNMRTADTHIRLFDDGGEDVTDQWL